MSRSREIAKAPTKKNPELIAERKTSVIKDIIKKGKMDKVKEATAKENKAKEVKIKDIIKSHKPIVRKEPNPKDKGPIK